jgi:cytidine deaminase
MESPIAEENLDEEIYVSGIKKIQETAIDWDALHAEAKQVMTLSYSPYSNFPVGVAALVDDGRIVTGCNVENASYGLTLCAECGLISNLIASGGGRLIAVLCVGSDGEFLAPCGRCRQILFEHGGSDCLLMTPTGAAPLSEMLPWAFGPEDLT